MTDDTSPERIGKVRYPPIHCLHLITTRHEIPLDKLETYLRTTVPEISVPLQVEQFTYGQVNNPLSILN